MKIVFVYAGDPKNGEIRAPYSITRNLYNYLNTIAPVEYYDWCQGEKVVVGKDDIFIGHPNYPSYTVTHAFFNSNQPCRAKFLIHPLHTNFVNDNMPFNHMVVKADRVFSIMGPYWYNNLPNTPFAHWGPKITRLDMAIDPTHFQYVKDDFNQPGKRKLLYIGSSIPNKNLDYMYRIMRAMPEVELHWYGADDHKLSKLPNVKPFGHTFFSVETSRKIANECDIFISTSISDANPTTLLESAAWGLIPICTKESGYYSDHRNDNMFSDISLDDINASITNIRALLNAPSEILKARSVRTRSIIENKYSWSEFCGRIDNIIRRYLY